MRFKRIYCCSLYVVTFFLKISHKHSNIISDCDLIGSAVLITSTVDHVGFIGFVKWPTVVLTVVQVVPATCLSNATNTHLQMHTQQKII